MRVRLGMRLITSTLARRFTCLLAFLTLSLGCSPPNDKVNASTAEQATTPADDIAPYLKALPPNTEALIVVRGPYRTTLPMKLGMVESLRMLATIFLPIDGGPENPNADPPPFPVVDVQVAVLGTGNFEEPKDFGLGPFEGCLFLKLTAADNKAVQSWIERARKSQTTVGGKEFSVIGSRTGDSNKEAGLYMGFENETLLVATDEKYLQTVLQRMKANSAEEAFPPDLQHWKLVDRAAKNFGLRKFIRKEGNRLYEMPDKSYKGATVEVTEDTTTVHWLSSEISPLVSMDKDAWLQLASYEATYTKLIGKPSEDHEKTITYLSQFSYLIGPPLYL